MKKEEYEKAVKSEKDSHAEKLRKLAREYAFANNPYRVGDIVTDHYQTIVVEKIRFSMGFNVPYCTYTGAQLTKKRVPRVDGQVGTVHQPHIVEASQRLR